MNRFHVLLVLAFCLTSISLQAQSGKSDPAPKKPNILFVFADDWGGDANSAIYGGEALDTPNFDRVTSEGALFKRAFVPGPTCTPSRSGLISGQHIWRLGPGANLHGAMPPKNPAFPLLLEEKANYFIGRYRKGMGANPAAIKESKWTRQPAGPSFGNRNGPNVFKKFLNKRPNDRPFCFWYGSKLGHRSFSDQRRKKMNIDPANVVVPPYLPDAKPVRRDIANYYAEIQQFDRNLGKLLNLLKKHGELQNTLVVVSGDHGWAFPRGKTQLYDSGTRVPLAMLWPEGIEDGTRIDALVNLSDLAPTFLELGSVEIPDRMTAHSLVPLMTEQETIRDQPHWQRVFTARERHTVSQEEPTTGGYPMRAIRTADFLYIYNVKPDRWPGGTPNWKKAQKNNAWLSDTDNGPTKFYMWANRDQPHVKRLYDLSYAKRPQEELYDLAKDPYQMNNVADNPNYSDVKKRLRRQLMKELKSTGDPRVTDREVKFGDFKNYVGWQKWPGKDTIEKYKENDK